MGYSVQVSRRFMYPTEAARLIDIHRSGTTRSRCLSQKVPDVNYSQSNQARWFMKSTTMKEPSVSIISEHRWWQFRSNIYNFLSCWFALVKLVINKKIITDWLRDQASNCVMALVACSFWLTWTSNSVQECGCLKLARKKLVLLSVRQSNLFFDA